MAKTASQIERLWLQSFPAYSKDNLKIQTMEGDLVRFQENEVQRLVDEIEDHIVSEGRLIRLHILKARRQGMSTREAGIQHWRTTTRHNRYALMITHEPEATDFLFGMHRRFYAHSEWKPETRYSNKKILEFNKADGSKGGLDSAIRVATAGKEDVGSGQLVHYLHLSEVAKWPAHTAKQILTSILQCVPDSKDTRIVFESTAKGIGGEFHDRYWAARYHYEAHIDESGKPTFRVRVNEEANEANQYSSIFLAWFIFKKYQAKVPPGFKRYTSHPTYGNEEELVKLYGLNNRHLQWRRLTIDNKCNGDIKQFYQEYPSSAEEAFVSSGNPAFDPIQVRKLMNAAPDPIQRYEAQLATGQFIADKDGRLRVWEEPIMGEEYLISADVSEGIEVNTDAKTEQEGRYDFSSADVWNRRTGKQVANFHGLIDPDQFGILLCHMGKRYNNAWLAPERNNQGLATVLKIMDLRYPNVYVEKIPDPPNKPRKRYGWLTSRATKPVIINSLQAEMRDGTHGIQCKDTFREMLSYKRDEKGQFGAEEKRHDDRVMSAAIGKYVMGTLPGMGPKSGQQELWNMPPKADDAPSASSWT